MLPRESHSDIYEQPEEEQASDELPSLPETSDDTKAAKRGKHRDM
jgi:hypothetical protein